MTPLLAPDATRLRRLNALLDTALALPTEMREPWLDALDAQDEAGSLTLRALLARMKIETDDFLHQPVALGLDDFDDLQECAGERIGPYRLIRELGSGGMATVWLAEREDDAAGGGLQRHVALKLPALGGGPGLGRRMARERDILATLEHPRIARLYEAGITAEGRPWLAMEHVEGLPLDAHCRDYSLDVPERLRLFLQIAEAVAYAHARLVVHRDLKPGNILVTAQGEVRLLDFGIAKLLQDESTEGTQLTRVMGRAITPDYASPEQAGGRPVTAASDVYSLGIVLYELLTSQRPYHLSRGSTAVLEEAILAAEVPPASSCVAKDRKLMRQLRGDLDTILAKALRKDAGQRYLSVESMAADVQRHLDGRPVLARPPSRRYRIAKLLRRHWRGAGAVATVVLALGTGLAVASWQWREASRQRLNAMTQLAHSQAALDFSQAVLTEGLENDEKLSLAELLRRSHRFVEREATPLGQAMGANTLASLYLSYGNYRDAEPVMARAIAAFPPALDTGLLRHLRCKQAHAWSKLDRKAEAVAQLAAVIERSGSDHASATYCLRLRAQIARDDNQAAAALAFATESLRRLDAADSERPLERAMVRAELAYAHALLGRPDLADLDYAAAMAEHAARGRSEGITAVPVLNNWGIALLNSGRPLQALERFEQATAIAQRRSPGGRLPPYLIGNRANALRVLGRVEEAHALFRQMRAVVAQMGGSKSLEIYAWAGEAQCEVQLQHWAAAQAAIDEALALTRAEPQPALSPASGALLMARAQLKQAQGQWSEARDLLDSVIAAGTTVQLSNSLMVLAHLNRGEASLLQLGPDAARADLQQALAIGQQMQHGLRHTSLVGQAWLALGKLHRQAGCHTPAREAFALAAEHLTATIGAEHPQTREAAQGLKNSS